MKKIIALVNKSDILVLRQILSKKFKRKYVDSHLFKWENFESILIHGMMHS